MIIKSELSTIKQLKKEIEMNNSKLTLPFTVALILSGAHSASATVKKCAFDSCRDDAKIAMNVQALLDSHAELGPPNSIQVQSFDHVVYLHGIVDTRLEKEIAESVAAQATDVAHVVNSIVENN